MTGVEALGFVATAMTSSSFVPQVWHTWKSRDVSGISTLTYTIITIGLLMWLVYGYLRGDAPLIIANGIMVVLTGAILAMKLVFSGRATATATRH